MADGKVIISTKLDNSGVEKGLAGLQTAVKKFAGTLGLAFGMGAIVAVGKKMIDLASDITEVQNVVDTAFGSMAYKMETFADTAIETAGMSKLAAKQMGSTFMAMSAGMGQAVEQGSDMAVDMTQRMGDIMSFYNKTLSESETIGRAVYSGETEPLKQIGVIMNQNALELYAMQNGYKQLYKDMNAAEQLFVRQQFFLNATNLAAGDFIKTQDSWANQTRILTETCKELGSVLGSSLITMLTPALQLVNSMVSAMLELAKTFNAVITAIFGSAGKQIGQTQQQAEAVSGAIGGSIANQEDLTEETKKTGKAAKGNLSTFDELNVLQKQTDSGTGTGTGSSGGAALPEGMPPDAENAPGAIEVMVAKIQALLAPLQAISFDNLLLAFDRLKKAVEPLGQAVFAGLEWGYRNVLVPLAKWTIEDAIPAGVEALADVFDYFGGILEILIPMAEWIWDNFLVPFGQLTADTAIESVELYRKAVQMAVQWITDNKDKILGIFAAVAPLLKEIGDAILRRFDKVKGLLMELYGALVDVLVGIMDFIVGVFAGDWEQAWNGLKLICQGLVDAILALFTYMWWSLYDTLMRCIESIKLILLAIGGWIYNAVITPIVDSFIKLWNAITSTAKTCWNVLVSIWKVVADWFDINVVQPVLLLFTTLWENVKSVFTAVWDWLSAAFKDYINGWIGIVEGFANMFVRAINKIIESINSLSFDVPDWDIFGDLAGRSFGFSLPSIPELKLPRLATGAVIPANREFMAVLGDQKRGMNIEAPADLIRQIVREESGEREITIRFEGSMAQLVRILKPELDREAHRRGTRLVTGGIG